MRPIRQCLLESRVHPVDSGRSPSLGAWVLAKTVAMPGCASGGSTPALTWDGAHTTFKREMVRDSSSEQSRSTPDTIYQVLSKWEEKETKLSQGLPI